MNIINIKSLKHRCALNHQDPQLICDVLWFVCLQAVRLSDHRGRLYLSGLSSGLQPLPSERTGPELQSSRRLRSEAAVCSTGGSRLETGHSQVWRVLLQPQTVSSPIHTAHCQFSASASVWISWRHRWVKFHPGADPPLEVVSGARYWRTEPVWMN